MRTRIHFLLMAAGLASAVALTGCGGAGSATTPPTSTAQASPTYITAGDAPMSSVLDALVTVSAVSFTNASGSTVALLSQPTKIELTHLGGIRAPLKLAALPQGTYNSVSLTVSAATITYIDSTGTVQTAMAVVNSGTVNVTLTPALKVGDSAATDVRFDFDLQNSLDLTNSVVTFTPHVGAIVARVKDEDNTRRRIHIAGKVQSTSTTANTITLTTLDTQMSVTLNVDSNTKFAGGLSLASLQPGMTVQTVDILNADGSITAQHVAVADANPGETAASGVVTTVQSSNGTVSSFTLVARESSDESDEGQSIVVNVTSGTDIQAGTEAQDAGLTTFDQTQIFPGQAVWVAGASATNAGTVTITATKIRPAQVNPFGLTAAAVTTSSSGFVLPMLVDNQTFFDQFAKISGNLSVDTNASTDFDGQGLSSSNVASLAVGTPIVARGYLQMSGTVGAQTTTLFATTVSEEGSDHPNH